MIARIFFLKINNQTMSDAIKHECGIALVRLKKPLHDAIHIVEDLFK